MGRKPAPHPLTLSDPAATPDDGSGPGARQTIRQVHSPTAAIVASTKSPRSPLSPFRLSPKRSPRDQEKQSSDDTQRPRQLRKNSPNSTPTKANSHVALSPTTTTTSDQGQTLPSSPVTPYRIASGNRSPVRLDPGSATRNSDEASSPYLPLAATLHQASQDTLPPQQTQRLPPVINQIQEEEGSYQEPPRTAKGSSFFFSFHKSSKSSSSQRLVSPASPTTQQNLYPHAPRPRPQQQKLQSHKKPQPQLQLYPHQQRPPGSSGSESMSRGQEITDSPPRHLGKSSFRSSAFVVYLFFLFVLDFLLSLSAFAFSFFPLLPPFSFSLAAPSVRDNLWAGGLPSSLGLQYSVGARLSAILLEFIPCQCNCL